MNSAILRSSLVAVAIFLLCSCDSPADVHDVTSVIADPEKYLGRQIDVSGCFLSGRHGIGIYDCRDRLRLLSVSLSPDAEASPKGVELVRLGYEQWPPASSVTVSVRVRGVLSRANERGFDFEISEVLDASKRK